MHLLIVFTLCIVEFGSSAFLKKTPLKVSLYTESYCPDCIKFNEEQLLPVFKEFSTNLLIDIVPFGFAEQKYVDGHWEFNCQHGEMECYGNKLQACAIQEACGDGGSVHCETKKLGQVLKYITCVEADPDQEAASDKCATAAGLTPKRITDCAKGSEGDHLLNLYGNRTEAVTPPITWVPGVAINDVISKEAEHNLRYKICILRPDLCQPASIEKKSPVKVTVFSESYCPYCNKFTSTQLLPAFKEFSTNLLIDLVPFGNAEQKYVDGHWTFYCQHGEMECYGNKLQACAIQEACGDGGSVHCETKKLGQVLKYITCVEADPDQEAASDKCATAAGLTPKCISDCAEGEEGDHLLNLYGNRTKNFTPHVPYVPYVVINDVPSKEAEDHLRDVICKLRPDLCQPASIEVIMI